MSRFSTKASSRPPKGEPKNRPPPSLGTAFFAALLFAPHFYFGAAGPLGFWGRMSVILLLLTGGLWWTDPGFRGVVRRPCGPLAPPRALGGGLIAAAMLYGVFFAGRRLAAWVLPGAESDLSAVYAFKHGVPPLRIAVLLLFWIGPGEEWFWRAGLQRQLSARWGAAPALWVTIALYAAVHVGTGNVLLLLAAAVCGLFWGWLWLRYRSLALNAVSHAVWDALVFLVFPFA